MVEVEIVDFLRMPAFPEVSSLILTKLGSTASLMAIIKRDPTGIGSNYPLN